MAGSQDDQFSPDKQAFFSAPLEGHKYLYEIIRRSSFQFRLERKKCAEKLF
jgi:hypothetical protein